MKKLLLGAMLCLMMVSCVRYKRFTKEDGSSFLAEPYGWADANNKKIDGVRYECCIPNVLISIVCVEFIPVPVILTGWYLFEPVDYVEQNEKM